MGRAGFLDRITPVPRLLKAGLEAEMFSVNPGGKRAGGGKRTEARHSH